MTRSANVYGGGARTNENGLLFEQETSLNEALCKAGYQIIDTKVFSNGELVGYSVPQRKLYSKFLSPRGIDYSTINSKRWLPDEAFVNMKNSTAYIIEKKFQKNAGSVDEKLPGCDFKKMEYEKLFSRLGFKVELFYVFNDWFKDSRYADVLQYIEDVGCKYYYNEIPLVALGLW